MSTASKDCDEYNAVLTKLCSFILTGRTPVAALRHVPCTVSRRAERSNRSALDEQGERDLPKVTVPPLDPDDRTKEC